MEISEQNLTKGLFHIAILCSYTFSSPYQGVVGLCLIATHLIYTYQWKILLPILPSLLLGGWYYGAVSAGDVHASVTPAHASITESARLYGFLIPQNIAENGGTPLMGPLGRIHNLSNLPRNMIYSNRWPWLMSTATDYIGIVLISVGLYGLWMKKNIKIYTMLFMITVIAMGQQVSIGSVVIPLPWSLSKWIPGSKICKQH